MATELKSVLVLGATGVIGQYIIRSLIEAQASFDRLAVFTSPSTVQKKAKEIESLEEKGVQVIVGDLTNQENVLKAYEGQSFVLMLRLCRNWDSSTYNLKDPTRS
jgi:uncharacterized protein YbjT (DUF2867 family)